MLAKITGIIDFIGQDAIYVFIPAVSAIDKFGISYEINIKSSDISMMHIGMQVSFFIKQITKEDGSTLYGFLSLSDKIWFECLIKLDGLGPRTALAILSAFKIDQIRLAIVSKDENFFTAVSGIGKKIASRIVNEMQTQLSKIDERILVNMSNRDPKMPLMGSMDSNQDSNNDKEFDVSLIQECMQALVQLGFDRNKVYKEVYDIMRNSNDKSLTAEDIIKEFLINKK